MENDLKKNIYIYIYPNYFAVHLKLTQHCNYTSVKKIMCSQGIRVQRLPPSLPTLDFYRHLECLNSWEVKVELLQAL